MSRIKTLARPNILAMKPYVSARDQFQGTAKIYLDANENPTETGLNRYPDGKYFSLRSKLAAKYNLQKENVVLGNGSDELIDMLLKVFCDPQTDAIAFCTPTYGMYKVAADSFGIDTIAIAPNEDFEWKTKKILRACTSKTKLLFLCSPNNPTGNVLAEKDLVDLLQNFEGLVVLDEAYIDFASVQSKAEWVSQYDNLVVLQTLSKSAGLAGLRLGTAYAATETIALMDKIRAPYNINTITAEIAYAKLFGGEKNIQLPKLNESPMPVNNILAERKKLENALPNFSFVEKVYTSEANFLLVKVADANLLYGFLIDRGIIVRNRTNEPGCQNCLRITIGTALENIALLSTLRQFEEK